jgi:3-hydroxyisobutyrate dehydrogenase
MDDELYEKGIAIREEMLGPEHGRAKVESQPDFTREFEELVTRYCFGSVWVIDAPVSGGITRAEAGTLSLMVGGRDEDAFAQVLPVLQTLGQRIFRTGPLGSGHAMKALNNFLGASAYTTAAKALAIGKEFGLDPRVMLDVVNSSTGRSFNTEVVLKDDVVTGRYGTGFALGLLAKDVGIAADLAEAVGVNAPACQLVRNRWAEAAAGLGFAADHSEAHKQWWTIDLAAGASGEGASDLGAPG